MQMLVWLIKWKKQDFQQGIRFAEWLGLEREGLMKKWGFDGSDQYMYARIF